MVTIDYVEIKESKGSHFFKEIEELRQVYNLQFTQVTESKILLNCKFPIATTKGVEHRLVSNMIDYSERNNCYSYDWPL